MAADVEIALRAGQVRVAVNLGAESLLRLPTRYGDLAVRRALARHLQPIAAVSELGEIVGVALSADGARMATGSRGGKVVVLDVRTGGEIGRWKFPAPLNAVALSPDGTRVALAGPGREARIVDVDTGEELARYTQRGWATALAFDADGTRLAVGGYRRVSVIEVVTGAEVSRFGHNRQVRSLTFVADGSRLLAIGRGTALVYDNIEGVELHRLSTTWRVALSPDGTKLAVGDEDRLRLLLIDTGAEVFADEDIGATALAFSPDGARLAVGSWQGIALYDVAAGAALIRFDGGKPLALAFLYGGALLAAAGADGVRVVDPALRTTAHWEHAAGAGRLTVSVDGSTFAVAGPQMSACFTAGESSDCVRLRHDDHVSTVDFSPDGTRVATAAGWDGSARLFDARTGIELLHLHHGGTVNTAKILPPGDRLLSAGHDEHVRIFDATTGEELARLSHDGDVYAVAVSPDGTRIATGADDRTARIFDAATGAELVRLEHPDWVRAVLFSPDGTILATCLDNRSPTLVDVASGSVISPLPHYGGVYAMSFSRDSRLLATAGVQGAKVFDTATAALTAHIQVPGEYTVNVALSADGTRIAIASDNFLHLADLASGRVLTSVDHEDKVWGLALSPDGSRLATAAGKIARVLAADTGVELVRLEHDAEVREVVFSPDGTRLAVAGHDSCAPIHEVHPERLVSLALGTVTRPLDLDELSRHGLPSDCAHVLRWSGPAARRRRLGTVLRS